jgi:hypothetical protein
MNFSTLCQAFSTLCQASRSNVICCFTNASVSWMNFSTLCQASRSNVICCFTNASVELHEWIFQHYVKLLDQTWFVVLEVLVSELHEWTFQYYIMFINHKWFAFSKTLALKFMNENFNIISRSSSIRHDLLFQKH